MLADHANHVPVPTSALQAADTNPIPVVPGSRRFSSTDLIRSVNNWLSLIGIPPSKNRCQYTVLTNL